MLTIINILKMCGLNLKLYNINIIFRFLRALSYSSLVFLIRSIYVIYQTSYIKVAYYIMFYYSINLLFLNLVKSQFKIFFTYMNKNDCFYLFRFVLKQYLYYCNQHSSFRPVDI